MTNLEIFLLCGVAFLFGALILNFWSKKTEGNSTLVIDNEEVLSDLNSELESDYYEGIYPLDEVETTAHVDLSKIKNKDSNKPFANLKGNVVAGSGTETKKSTAKKDAKEVKKAPMKANKTASTHTSSPEKAPKKRTEKKK